MKTILRSSELTCPSCITKIEKGLKVKPGVENARVFFNTGRIEVEHNPEVITSDELAKIVTSLGYQANVARY